MFMRGQAGIYLKSIVDKRVGEEGFELYQGQYSALADIIRMAGFLRNLGKEIYALRDYRVMPMMSPYLGNIKFDFLSDWKFII